METTSPTKSDNHKEFVVRLRRLISQIDDYIHLLVAILLMSGAIVVLFHSALTLSDLSIQSVLGLINDMLFVIIILELVWIMLSYLGRRRFPIASFILIGIISSIRRILLIEAQASFDFKTRSTFLSPQTVDLLLYVIIVVALVIGYYLLARMPDDHEIEMRQKS